MLKKLAVVLSMIMVMGVTGCSSTSGDKSSGNDSKTIKVMLSEEPGAGDSFATSLHAWEKETGNKVDIMVIPYDDQSTKFPAMAKNNDLPDLITTTKLHQLYPEEFVDLSTVVDTSKFEPNALKLVGKDYKSDKISGLPIQYTTTNMYYNQDAFKAAGLTAPTVDKPWTWDEVYKNAEILKSKGGVKYGLAVDPSRARYDTLMYANGGSLVEKNGDSFTITLNSAKNVDTLDRFIKENGKTMPKAIWSGGTTDNPADYFKNGDVGIYLSGSWNYNTFSNSIKSFKLGVMPTPKGESSSSAIIGGGALAIPNKGKNKDVAISFIKWMYSDTNFQTYLNNDKGLSALKNVQYKPADEKAAADYTILQAEVKSVTDSFMVDESSAWRSYLDSEYRDSIKKAVSGEVTAKKALDDFAKSLSEKSGWKIK